MKLPLNKKSITALLSALLAFNTVAVLADNDFAPSANGIEIPQGYKNWRVISVSHRTDNNSLRAIVGNSTAVNAARQGKTKPWPTGTILGKLVWKDSQHPDWDHATVPAALSHIEFMIKDPVKYKSTGGWGYARWKGMKAEPYGKDASFALECYSCHGKVKSTDYVFTRAAPLP